MVQIGRRMGILGEEGLVNDRLRSHRCARLVLWPCMPCLGEFRPLANSGCGQTIRGSIKRSRGSTHNVWEGCLQFDRVSKLGLDSMTPTPSNEKMRVERGHFCRSGGHSSREAPTGTGGGIVTGGPQIEVSDRSRVDPVVGRNSWRFH